jgi:serine/threonine protein kinase
MAVTEHLGTPKAEDLGFILNEKVRKFVESLPVQDKKAFHTKFEYCPSEWEDFLEKALTFDPKKRLTIKEAMKHPIFNNIRLESDLMDSET